VARVIRLFTLRALQYHTYEFFGNSPPFRFRYSHDSPRFARLLTIGTWVRRRWERALACDGHFSISSEARGLILTFAVSIDGGTKHPHPIPPNRCVLSRIASLSFGGPKFGCNFSCLPRSSSQKTNYSLETPVWTL